jgi:hypothetical protein
MMRDVAVARLYIMNAHGWGGTLLSCPALCRCVVPWLAASGHAHTRACACVRLCACVHVRARARACVRSCMCVRACACVGRRQPRRQRVCAPQSGSVDAFCRRVPGQTASYLLLLLDRFPGVGGRVHLGRALADRLALGLHVLCAKTRRWGASAVSGLPGACSGWASL